MDILVILVAFVLAYIAEKRNDKRYLFFCCLVLGVHCGLRDPSVGNDTRNYISFFYDIQHFGIFYGSDIGFSLTSYLLMMLFNNHQILLLVYSLLTIYLIIYRLWDFRFHASFTLMLIIFSIIYYPYCFNIVRQFLAIAIVFWGTRYLDRKEIVRYIVLNLIAMSFHSSALICILFLLLNKNIWAWLGKYKKKIYKYVIPIVIMSTFLFLPNLNKYLERLNFSFSIHLMVIFKITCFLFITYKCRLLTYQKNAIAWQGDSISRNIVLFYSIGLLLSLIGMFFSFMNRIGFYFMMFEMPFWSLVVNKTKYKKTCLFAMACVLMYYFFSALVQ